MNILNNKNSRTIVNIIGVPTILFCIYVGDNQNIPFYSLFIGVVLYCALIEYRNLIKRHNGEILFSVLLCTISIIQIIRFWYIDEYFKMTSYIYTTCMLFGVLILCIEIFRKSSKPLFNIMASLFGFFWIGLMLGSLALIREFGFEETLIMFISVWIADTCAYGFGSQFGESKILPNISPNKTWIGSISGYLGALVTLIVFNYYYNHIFDLTDIICLSIVFGIFSQLGDFVESLLKREVGIKDMGNLLRGHGGMLDRFDSMFLVAPLTFLYYFIF